jgi:hypothetical protein
MRDASCTRERRSPTVSVLQYAQGHDSRGPIAEQPVICPSLSLPTLKQCTPVLSQSQSQTLDLTKTRVSNSFLTVHIST